MNQKVLSSIKVLKKRTNQKTIHNGINEGKYSDHETEHEEPSVKDIPVVKEPSYFNLFKYGKNRLNRLDMTCKQVCMVTSRDKYYL